ncbi:MAG: response regulator [Deltaproteobacteria bacterium]|nr:response regulator [Deltaproteobacteria bacterium]
MSRIMIVDDDFDTLRYCEGLLAPQGNEILIHTDAHRALKVLEQHPVDLLIVDIVMPAMSGFDFIHAVKKLEQFNAPILMLTGRSAPKDVLTALELGATDYLVKPIDKDLFVGKIASIIGARPRTPEVRFAQGATDVSAEIAIPARITAVSEMGLTMRTRHYLDRNVHTKVDSPLFEEIGIAKPQLRAVHSKPVENDAHYRYEVFVSFIGLDQLSMQRIRRWIINRAIATRKAG